VEEVSQYALCIAISARGQSGINLPQKEGPHVLPRCCRAASCPPAHSALHSPLVCFDGWLSRHLLSRRLDLALRITPPFPVHSTHGFIAVAPFASPSCRPLPLPLHCRRAVHRPLSLVDCCHFNCHRRVNVHPPLLSLRSLCCACQHRPLLSHHPLPPLLVDCCIVCIHCRITIAPSYQSSPLALSLLRCRRDVPVYRRSCELIVVLPSAAIATVVPPIAATAVALSRLPSPSPLSPLHLYCAFNRRRRRITVAPSIVVAIVLPLRRPSPTLKVSLRWRPLRWRCLQPTWSPSSQCAGGEGRCAALVWICP
jgi:hypothetical protein